MDRCTPLAFWIASNWWLLTSHVCTSAVDTRYWTWQNARRYPWMARHNMRAAGDGMAWPDLTVVAEGAVTRIVWSQDDRRHLAPVRFASEGSTVVRTGEFQVELAQIVTHALERLAEAGLPKTPLAEEWSALARADGEEQAFCRTVARMGLDPYSVSDEMADEVVAIAAGLPAELGDDFFDSAAVSALASAADWTRRAMPVAGRAAARAARALGAFAKVVSSRSGSAADSADADRPWTPGYSMARRLRNELGVRDTDPFDASEWMGLATSGLPRAASRDSRRSRAIGAGWYWATAG